MIEKKVLNYLSENLSVSVFMETPEKIPEKYVLIEKTGSGLKNHINNATFAIQSISSKSLLEAAELNEMVKELMLNIIYTEDISRSELNSDYNFTNPETKQYRYQAVFDLVF